MENELWRPRRARPRFLLVAVRDWLPHYLGNRRTEIAAAYVGGECHVRSLSQCRLDCVRPTRAACLGRVRARHSDDGCLGRAEVSPGGISRRIVTNTLGFRIVVPGLALIDERVLRHPFQLPVAKWDQLERSQRQEP